MYNFLRHYALAFVLLIESCSGHIAVAQPTILNATPTANPGEAISLQGFFGAKANAFLTYSASTKTIALPVLVQGVGQLSAHLPELMETGLYRVWVEDGQQRSLPVFINQAKGMHFDSPEVAPGGTLRLFGRNLLLRGASPQVRFVAHNASGGGQATINISQSDAYTLSFIVPATLQPGVIYDAFVSNGNGGSAGETKVEQSVLAITAGVDYFQLGVPWASKFTFYSNVYNVKTDSRLALKAIGDGIADDQAAIQAAIMQANNDGGGVVYLPAGTYKLLVAQGEGLTLYSNVVLRGAGAQQTSIKYGYGEAGFKFGLIFYGNGQKMGLADLSLENINESGHWVHNVYTGYPGQVSDVFLSNVYATYSGEALTFSGHPSRLLLKDCRLISKYNPQIPTSQGPLTILAAENVTLKHNYIQHEVNQTVINDDVRNLVVEQNTFVRDCALQYQANPIMIETRTLSINFANNVALLANSFESINGKPKNNNDGETILNEGGAQQRRDAYYGNVSGATPTTLQDNTASWGALTTKATVVIIYGKGTGQIRKITSNDAQELTIEHAWDVMPDASSRYSITTFSAENWLIKDNTLLNNNQGILLFGASCQQVAIIGNKLSSNGGIWLRPGQEVWNGAQVFNVIYNAQVVGNTVENLGSSVPAFIGVVPYQYAAPVTMGTGAIGIEVRNNVLRALPSFTPTTLYGVDREGYYSYFRAQFSGHNGDVPVTLGTIFQNNTAQNCPAAFYLNSGSYNTLVCNNTLTAVNKLIQDDPLPNCPHASVNTVRCLATQPGTGNQRPVADPKQEFISPNQTKAINLSALTGSDEDGTISSFIITQLPAITQGTLSFRGQSINLTDSISTMQADSLIFQPAGTLTDDVLFKYAAIDNQHVTSEAAAYTVSVASPMPVELLSFTGKACDAGVLLQWNTVTEENTDYFAVERSVDGTAFLETGHVKFKSKVGIQSAYQFIDRSVDAMINKPFYYRLKLVDVDGTVRYSDVRVVALSAPLATTIQIYPNPTIGLLNVVLPVAGAHCTIYSTTGELLLKQYTATTKVAIDVTGLRAEAYLLQVHTGKGPDQWYRFLKKDS